MKRIQKVSIIPSWLLSQKHRQEIILSQSISPVEHTERLYSLSTRYQKNKKRRDYSCI